MATTYDSQAQLRELTSVLSKWVAETMPFATQSFDADGNPVLTLSEDATPATTEKVVVIRITPFTYATAKDVLGLPALAAGPTKIQICTEANPAGGAGADILGPAELLPVMAECSRCGMILEWYVSAAGTVPSTAQMTAGNLEDTWQPLYNGLMGAR